MRHLTNSSQLTLIILHCPPLETVHRHAGPTPRLLAVKGCSGTAHHGSANAKSCPIPRYRVQETVEARSTSEVVSTSASVNEFEPSGSRACATSRPQALKLDPWCGIYKKNIALLCSAMRTVAVSFVCLRIRSWLIAKLRPSEEPCIHVPAWPLDSHNPEKSGAGFTPEASVVAILSGRILYIESSPPPVDE